MASSLYHPWTSSAHRPRPNTPFTHTPDARGRRHATGPSRHPRAYLDISVRKERDPRAARARGVEEVLEVEKGKRSFMWLISRGIVGGRALAISGRSPPSYPTGASSPDRLRVIRPERCNVSPWDLFLGSPGTGKTSFLTALAGHRRFNIYGISLAN
ncbi:hypothetical protein M427DRAFT_65364 [Gonapodya prolifera JEL478]|uniref:Uncharacterized protein n=1 Tax=Gonapodya prolifera (strain JEL478) TaxID=1344416 RepID=A0A139B091_GONPJ|nr:hypothetical protein M427DRAFT_65364 [Gonapodya prolifera JEL478]|eukprot:KXS22387.1 hypothetical protein M427DRAFT_65364 [Gonapodya prolifera JEL478]